MRSKSPLEVLGVALMEWQDHDFEDCYIAIKAAETMSKKWLEDAAIMNDLSVIKYSEAEGEILERVRYEP